MTAEFLERTVHGLNVRIDRQICVGFGDCAKEAPEAFELDADGLAVFVAPERVERDLLLRACAACPVDAILVWGEDGASLDP